MSTSILLEEVDNEGAGTAGEKLVRFLGKLIFVLVTERFHVILHLRPPPQKNEKKSGEKIK